LNPIKIFDSSFSGATLWENPDYVSPAAHRSALKKLKAGKYVARVQAKAAYEASRPTEPTYKVDPTDSVFDTKLYEKEHEIDQNESPDKPKETVKRKKGKSKLSNTNPENNSENGTCDGQTIVAELG